MSRRSMAPCGWLLALVAALAVPLAASQERKLGRGARVAVVALHDSRLLTLCPVFGRNVIASDFWTTGMEARVTVVYPFEGVQALGLHFGNQLGSMVTLPLPASAPTGAAVGQAVAPGVRELDRLATDVEVQRRAEQEFLKLKAYVIVESPADADFVFLLESSYIPMAAGTTPPPPARSRADNKKDTPDSIFSDTDREFAKRDWTTPPAPPAPPPPPESPGVVGFLGGDRNANWRQSAVAIVVPAGVYARHAGNGAALTAARLWEGLSAAGWGRGAGGSTMMAASPEALVDQFHGKGPSHPDYLPVCAASAATIRGIGDRAEAEGPDAGKSEPPAPLDAESVRRTRPAHFRSNITVVNVPMTVADSDGRNILDLTSSQFHVFEDGVEQRVDRLVPGTAPSHVALLVDASFGMRLASEGIRAAARALVDALRPGDRAMVVSFDSRVRVIGEFTPDRAEIERAIAQLRTGGGTRLYDTLALVTADRMSQVEGRKAIVLFTDGVDTRSRLTDAAGALATVETFNVSVYVIRYDTIDATAFTLPSSVNVTRWMVAPDDAVKNSAAHELADQYLERLSAGSGGRMYFAQADANIREIFAHISEELSRQYTLSYYPSNDKLDGTYRQIRVVVDRPGHTVRARQGYRAGTGPTSR